MKNYTNYVKQDVEGLDGWDFYLRKGEELDEELLYGVRKLCLATDGKVGFSLLGFGTCVMLDKEDMEDEKTMLEKTTEGIDEMLSGMPDFGTGVVDGVCGYVDMAGRCAVVIEWDDLALDGKGKIPYEMAYTARTILMSMGEEGNVRGVLMPSGWTAK